MANEEREWKQLNNVPEESYYIEFPLAFTGKPKNGRKTVFSWLTLSMQFILAEIYTMNKICKKPATLTYEHFINVFGMSKETVSVALKTLKALKIIEEVERSKYKIIANFYRKDYVTIDRYLLKHEWEVNGKKKRLARSRILILALLTRSVTNPKTNGVFISTQERIGVAVNLPRTTAGDSVRELVAAGAAQTEKQDDKVKIKCGWSKYFVNPQIIKVAHPNMSLRGVRLLYAPPSAEDLHKQLMLDTEYENINKRMRVNQSAIIDELRRTRGDGSERLDKLEEEKSQLAEELARYFEVHKINRAIFPPGFFLTDTIEDEAI